MAAPGGLPGTSSSTSLHRLEPLSPRTAHKGPTGRARVPTPLHLSSRPPGAGAPTLHPARRGGRRSGEAADHETGAGGTAGPPSVGWDRTAPARSAPGRDEASTQCLTLDSAERATEKGRGPLGRHSARSEASGSRTIPGERPPTLPGSCAGVPPTHPDGAALPLSEMKGCPFPSSHQGHGPTRPLTCPVTRAVGMDKPGLARDTSRSPGSPAPTCT